MRFLILGQLEVHSDDGAVALGGVKPRAVLAVLLLHANEAVSAERLALALWGEDAPGGSTKTVQVHVSRLRRALGDADRIETTPAGYCLRVHPDELDAAHFERLFEDGRRALAGGQPQQAATFLREALELWRGPPLADLEFEPFARGEVARLEEQRLAALEARVEADLAAGRHAELIGELQQLVTANPTREHLVAHLMLALYRCGRQVDALEAYRDARRVLVDEMGVEPGPELRELHEAILRQDAALEVRGGDVPELPPELDAAAAPPLAGRVDELAWLRLRWERSRRGAGGLVVLAGERGAGKSRLAAELAGDAHRRGDIVLYATGQAPAAASLAVMRSLGDVTRPTLLVVDHIEAVSDEVRAQIEASTRSLAGSPVLVLVCCEDAEAAAGLRGDATLRLEPLDAEAVRAIGRQYASTKVAAEIPADRLLDASGGVPRRVHEVASRWARREAARRVTVVAGRAATERAQLDTIRDELAGGVVELQEARERILPRREGEPRVVCPFKGLASYEASDAKHFFGRERLVAELVARLVGAPLLAVVGPSGSGKSSVMRAGLLPALADGVLPGSQVWGQALMRPGRQPLRQLAAALADAGDRERVVLAIDQFEETFTACDDEAERAEFIGELVAAARDPSGRYVVVLALRADQYGRCAAYPELSRLLAANNVLVPPMQRDELRRAVENPCQQVGLRIEHELVEALVGDVEREPGALPLLSTALLELWQRRDGRRLRHSAYVQTGGVRGAVARLAEDAFAQLDEAQQAVARGVLMRLVGAADADAVERRRVDLAELELDRDEDVARVVALLTDRRLLTISAGNVELAHEALLREWPRLRGWIEEDREGLRIQRGLRAAAEEWERLGRDEGALLRGARLSEAVEWRDARGPALNEREREFLAAGEASREHERVTRRRRVGLVAGAVGTAVLAAATVGVAALFAGRERAIAASRDLAAQSAALVGTDPALGLALARDALERHDTAEARNALRQAALADRTTAVVRASKGKTYVAEPRSDGRRVVTAGEDGTVRVWSLDGGMRLERTVTTHGSPAIGAAYSADGTSIASVAYDGEVSLTPAAGGDRKPLLRLKGGDGEYPVKVDLARDLLVVGTSRGVVRLVPTRGGRRPFVLGRHPARGAFIFTVAFNPTGTKVISGGEDGIAYIWDVATGASIPLRHGQPVFGASFSPDGARVATAAGDGRVRLWDARTGSLVGRPLQVDDQPLASLRFDADNRRVVTTGDDGVVRILDVRNGQLLSTMPSGAAQYADFVHGSRAIVSAGRDGTLRRWDPLDVRTPRESGTIPFFSPDGQRVVSGGDDGAVHLWDLAKGEQRLPGHGDLSITAFRPDGEQVVSVSHDSSVRLHDLRSGTSRTLRFPAFEKYGVAVNATGRIAVGGKDHPIVVQDAEGAGRIELRGHEGPVFALAFSSDDAHLASASGDGTARVWNIRTRKAERVIEADAEAVRSVSYSDDGRRLATAGADGTVRIWPVDGGRPVVLVGHQGPVNSAEFNHRGDRIVSTGLDGTVRVWDTAGGETLAVLHRHEGTASGAADFSPDGHSVVSAGADGMRITPCEVCGDFADVQRVADTRAPRTLSASERQRLVDRGG